MINLNPRGDIFPSSSLFSRLDSRLFFLFASSLEVFFAVRLSEDIFTWDFKHSTEPVVPSRKSETWAAMEEIKLKLQKRKNYIPDLCMLLNKH